MLINFSQTLFENCVCLYLNTYMHSSATVMYLWYHITTQGVTNSELPTTHTSELLQNDYSLVFLLLIVLTVTCIVRTMQIIVCDYDKNCLNPSASHPGRNETPEPETSRSVDLPRPVCAMIN